MVQIAKTVHGPHSSQLVICVVLCIVCVLMCIVLLPPGVNPVAFYKYIMSASSVRVTSGGTSLLHTM